MHFRTLAVLLFSGLVPLQVAAVDLGEIEAVTIKRTGCFGFCPEYTVTVSADGSVRYVGVKNVPELGPKESDISQRDVDFLFRAAERMPFGELAPIYKSREVGCKELWTDSPTTTITIRTRAEDRTVEYYEGCRGLSVFQRIMWFADTVDEVAGVSHNVTLSEEPE
jgi:hypothetical protein